MCASLGHRSCRKFKNVNAFDIWTFDWTFYKWKSEFSGTLKWSTYYQLQIFQWLKERFQLTTNPFPFSTAQVKFFPQSNLFSHFFLSIVSSQHTWQVRLIKFWKFCFIEFPFNFFSHLFAIFPVPRSSLEWLRFISSEWKINFSLFFGFLAEKWHKFSDLPEWS